MSFSNMAENQDTPSFLGQIGKEGYKGNTVTQKANSTTTSGIRLDPESALEKMATGDIQSQYDMLRGFLSQGPGMDAVKGSNTEQQNFVDMMRGINASGGMPTTEDTRRANMFADQLFAPQQEAMKQSFQFAQEDAAKLAARLNRPINDPIIQSKLLQNRMNQEAMLSADRTSFVAQEARNSPFQRLALQGQLADAQGALASQAMSNRMQLLNLGNSLQSQERNWRLQTGERYGTQSGTQTQHSGGGLMGGLGAMNAAVGSTMSAVGSVYSMGMGGGGSTDALAKQQQTSSVAPMNSATSAGGFMSPGGYNSQYLGSGMGMGGGSTYAPSSQRSSRLSGGGSSGSAQAPYYLSNSTPNQKPSFPWGSGIGF